MDEAPAPAPPQKRRLRRLWGLPVVPTLVLLAIVGALAWLWVARSSPSEQVLRTIDRQIKLLHGGRIGEFHATLAPKAKAACPYNDLKGELLSLPPDFWDLVDYRNIHVDVQGDRAVVTYDITYNGRVVERATAADPDVYTRATETVYGPPPNVDEELASLKRQLDQQVITPKEYEAQRKAIIARGTTRPIQYVKGQWYDDLDSHVRCSS